MLEESERDKAIDTIDKAMHNTAKERRKLLNKGMKELNTT